MEDNKKIRYDSSKKCLIVEIESKGDLSKQEQENPEDKPKTVKTGISKSTLYQEINHLGIKDLINQLEAQKNAFKQQVNAKKKELKFEKDKLARVEKDLNEVKNATKRVKL